MAENVADEEKASGDVAPEQLPEPEPKPVEIPDVELIVDGFGFMPKKQDLKSKTSMVISKKSKKEVTLPLEPVLEKSPCSSSTNIEIVRRKGVPDDVIAGFDTLEEYFQPRNPYFGSTIGRYANVIQDGTVVIRPSGRMYQLSNNKGHNHYNGGHVGFDKVNWRSYVNDNKVIMSHVSDRFNEGYPGTVMVQITFEVTCDNTIRIDMKCTTSEPTIKKVVGGTAYDFRVPRLLRTMMPRIPMGGYDVNFCVTQGTEQDLTFQARALHPGTGRVLEVYSNQPGLQFYTGNLLPDPDKIVEVSYSKRYLMEVAFEAKTGESGDESEGEESSASGEEEEEEESQRNFPNSVLNPGEVYNHRIQYKFGILLGKYV
ncbi:Aldose-1-epimerase [Operophtera brumata]|uniref:Galactose mutarotase n=1 Tax=Operophtera brumata TaxID=104452 RepID=A0A0L7LNW1_OPEBR|nr:Aldose-1-epimerase [Operophtera brumata]